MINLDKDDKFNRTFLQCRQYALFRFLIIRTIHGIIVKLIFVVESHCFEGTTDLFKFSNFTKCKILFDVMVFTTI